MVQTFSLSNGFAAGYDFETTFESAVNECLKSSRMMNTRNWLHVRTGGKWVEIGYTVKVAPMTWEFIQNVELSNI